MLKPITIAAFAVMAAATPAFAVCPTQPDGVESRYVENGQSRSLCLNQELNDSSERLRDETRYQDLLNSVQRNAIQRRFDMLPPVGNFGRPDF